MRDHGRVGGLDIASSALLLFLRAGGSGCFRGGRVGSGFRTIGLVFSNVPNHAKSSPHIDSINETKRHIYVRFSRARLGPCSLLHVGIRSRLCSRVPLQHRSHTLDVLGQTLRLVLRAAGALFGRHLYTCTSFQAIATFNRRLSIPTSNASARKLKVVDFG